MGIVLGWAVRVPGRVLPQLLSEKVPKDDEKKMCMAEQAKQAMEKERHTSQGIYVYTDAW